MAHPALSCRAAVRIPWARFLPPLSEPGVPIAGTGLSSGIMRLAHGLPGLNQRAGLASRGTRLAPLRWSDRCVVRPADALTTATMRVVPFAYACDDFWQFCSFTGVIGLRPLPEPVPFRHPFHLKLLSSAGITRRQRSYELLRHPGWPDLALTGRRLARATPPAGLPVLRPSPSSTRAVATTPAESAGARVARFPATGSLPRVNGGSASASPVSGPARRSLALRPAWSLTTQGGLCRRSASADVVTSFVRSDCYRLERQLPGGIRTR